MLSICRHSMSKNVVHHDNFISSFSEILFERCSCTTGIFCPLWRLLLLPATPFRLSGVYQTATCQRLGEHAQCRKLHCTACIINKLLQKVPRSAIIALVAEPFLLFSFLMAINRARCLYIPPLGYFPALNNLKISWSIMSSIHCHEELQY